MIYKLKEPVTLQHDGGATRTLRALNLRVGPPEARLLRDLFAADMPQLARAMATIDVCAGLPATTALAFDAEDISAAFTEIRRLVAAFADQHQEVRL